MSTSIWFNFRNVRNRMNLSSLGRTWSKICRTVRSASPTKEDMICAGVAVMNVAVEADATALTSVVLLHPGGP